MIITISGAGCTGKTTLIEALKKETDRLKIHRVHYHGEFIRDIFDIKYSMKYSSFEELLTKGSVDDITHIHMQALRVFSSIVERSSPKDILVFDRSPLDIAIYLYLNLSDKITDNLETYRDAISYIKYHLVNFTGKPDKIMYYTRPFSEEVEDDGFRPLSLIKKRDAEVALFDYKFLSSPTVHLLPDNLEDRVSVVMTDICRHVGKVYRV